MCLSIKFYFYFLFSFLHARYSYWLFVANSCRIIRGTIIYILTNQLLISQILRIPTKVMIRITWRWQIPPRLFEWGQVLVWPTSTTVPGTGLISHITRTSSTYQTNTKHTNQVLILVLAYGSQPRPTITIPTTQIILATVWVPTTTVQYLLYSYQYYENNKGSSMLYGLLWRLAGPGRPR